MMLTRRCLAALTPMLSTETNAAQRDCVDSPQGFRAGGRHHDTPTMDARVPVNPVIPRYIALHLSRLQYITVLFFPQYCIQKKNTE